MKVHTKTVWQMTDNPSQYELLEDDSFEYDGPLALAGGGGGDTTTENEPWDVQKPFLYDMYEDARKLRETHGGELYVPFSPISQEAMARKAMIARGEGLSPVAEEHARQTLRGDFLYGGPGFDAALEAASAHITPMISSQFAGSGTFGGGLHQASMAKELGRAFAGLYGEERTRQMQMAGLAPTIENLRYMGPQALGEIGAQIEAKELQKGMAPWQALQMQSGIMGTSSPYTSVTGPGAPGMSPLAGAATGAYIGSQVYPGWGTAVGAVLGGLLTYV